ncbi:hypothetical protein ACOMHN_066143 [Nucella lapillus]
MLNVPTAPVTAVTSSAAWSPPPPQSPTDPGSEAPSPPPGCIVMSLGSFLPWDNPDNLVSLEVERGVDMAVGVVVLPLLFLLSSTTNVLNVLVFWRQGVGERVNLCLFCLSLTDLLYMLHSFLLNVDRLGVFSTSSELGEVFKFIVRHRMVGFRGFSWVSGFLSMLIACDRCFCVLSPLRSKTVLKTRTTAFLIAGSSVLILAGFFVVCTRWDIACVYDPATNSTSTTVYGSQFYIRHKRVLDVMDGIVYGLVLPGLYVSVVLATTVVTLWKLRQLSHWRQQSSSATVTSRDLALTRMLVGVSVVYVVCMIPTLGLGVCILAVAEFNLRGRYYNTFNLMVSVFELFSYLNASFNFFVYCSLGSRYKQTLRGLFPCEALSKLLDNTHARHDATGDGAKSSAVTS